jgi:membrane protease YdiL (CAAX protease family)
MSTFLNPVRGSRESGWFRMLALVWVVIMWLFTGGVVTLGVMALNEKHFGKGLPAWALMLEQLIGFVPFFVAAFVVPLIYRRSITSGLSAAPSFRFKLYVQGIWSWGLVTAAFTGIGYLASPDDMHFHFSPAAFFPALVVGLLLLPLQTGAEELFFRGVIPQSLSQLLRKPLLTIVVSAALFAGLHLWNPEAQSAPAMAFLTYFTLALGWGWASFKTAGLEVTLGAHFINNFFGLFIVGYDNSVIKGASVWSIPAVDLSTAPIGTAVSVGLWLLLLRRIQRTQHSEIS